MRRNGYLDTINTFFGVLVSLISILSATVPIFSSKILDFLFVDTKAILFTSIAGLIIFIFTSWFTTSLDFFLLLQDDIQGKELNRIAKYRLISILLLQVSILGIYATKLLFETQNIGYSLASLVQISCYLLMYFFIGLHLGIAFQTARQTSNNQKLNQEKIDRLINLLIRSGHTPIKILNISPFNRKNEAGTIIESLNTATVEIAGERKTFTLSYEIDNILLTSETVENKGIDDKKV